MNYRTRFMLWSVPAKMRLRIFAIGMLDRFGEGMDNWLQNAIDRLNIDSCHRYDNAVTFREFITDDELFMFDEEDYD